ncbi:MAG: Ig-like domain-containing protein [Candidatus Edwardsbacteria bacterium]|nr:Ig-like domain-containing protein [Candidatus Edwardsbacteria bacterium]
MFSYGYDFTAAGNGDYFWRVRAGSAAYNWSGWSASRRFVIDNHPAVVDSSRPAHNNNNVPVNSVIRVYFSEPVRIDTSLHFTCTPDPGNWSVSQIGNVIDFDPATFN